MSKVNTIWLGTDIMNTNTIPRTVLSIVYALVAIESISKSHARFVTKRGLATVLGHRARSSLYRSLRLAQDHGLVRIIVPTNTNICVVQLTDKARNEVRSLINGSAE